MQKFIYNPPKSAFGTTKKKFKTEKFKAIPKFDDLNDALNHYFAWESDNLELYRFQMPSKPVILNL